MQTIGMIGGMSWESSLHYYRLINEEVRRRRGPLCSAELVMYSVDFAPLARMQAEARWDDAGAVLADAAARVERAGAAFVLLCCNTMYKVAPAIEARIAIPLLHIADATGAAVVAAGLTRVGLLGTRFTMEDTFIRDRLTARFGLEVLTPPPTDRARVHDVIYDELCAGRIEDHSRDDYRRIAAALAAQGAQGLIFGCTEISMLLAPTDVAVPVFDTLGLHALAAVERALAE
jgi:aspartate racemase